jgi:hypothetical protein
MDKIYIIASRTGVDAEYHLNRIFFLSKEDALSKIAGIAKEKYGEPAYAEESEEVERIKKYWAGDYSHEELMSLYSSVKEYAKASEAALYYDFIKMFWIKEYETA